MGHLADQSTSVNELCRAYIGTEGPIWERIPALTCRATSSKSLFVCVGKLVRASGFEPSSVIRLICVCARTKVADDDENAPPIPPLLVSVSVVWLGEESVDNPGSCPG